MTPKMIARVVGILFLLGDIAGILSVVVTSPSLGAFSQHDPSYLVKVSAQENLVILGALLLVTMAVTLALIPIVMYPLSKKFNETLALGYVVFRGALETIITIAMAISWPLLIIVGREYAAAGVSGASSVQTMGTIVFGAHDRLNAMLEVVFPLGALMFYAVLYRSQLIPLWLSG